MGTQSTEACLVCQSPTHDYFSKDFRGECGLERVSYTRCASCGFVSSRTHQEMSASEWESLNHRYHAAYLGAGSNPDDPRWLERIDLQAATIQRLWSAGLLPAGEWLDWGCGDGRLSDLVSRMGPAVAKYDKYALPTAVGFVTGDDLKPGAFDVVISTSVFEHFRESADFSDVFALLSGRGALALHTFVSEQVPPDPSWFYLLPVHCAFYTNASMQVLFERWGFTASVYAPEARMWFWFRGEANGMEPALTRAGLVPDQGFYCKRGFVDYWRD